jgi:choline dehydrogenase
MGPHEKEERMMYDYIVIGAGSAGCVVASRLTEDPNTTALLLEAGGPDDREEIHIPVAFGKLFKTECDWGYYTESQPHLNNRRLFWPRGKMLGGTSSHNAMVYIRGHGYIYDRWAAAGNTGWGYDDVLPYFKKSQHQERGASQYHGVGGPLNVADQRDTNPLSCAFVDACVERGFPRNDDFNGPVQEGFGYYQVTQKEGRRCSTATAFLRPAMDRPNLTVQTHALATRVLFEGTRAVGVAYLLNGETHEVHVTKEVILSGGAINSPHLLLLSGVGPAAQLAALDIPVVVDLPGVGQNLQDHLSVFINYECTEPISLANAATAAALLEYQHFRKGPLSSNVGEAGGYVKTRPELPLPDLQFFFGPTWFIEHGFVQPEGHGFTFVPTLLLPESRGSVRLRSRDPQEHPLIQPNYLASEADLETLVTGVKIIRPLADTKAFAPFVGKEFEPGSQVQSDDDIRAFIRNRAETLYHPVGTCKMGVDPMAVVDPRLRVHGTQGLRVADASIMPLITNGNTNAPSIMVGEKAADLLKTTNG